jgi:LacI family transcriptional regulator
MEKRSLSRPTIKDVALACGVSEATVSYVVNGKKTLKPDTREKVFRVMREMNYHPSAVARGLAQKRVHTLGVLFGVVDPVACLVEPYVCGVLTGVMAQAQKDGFNLTLFTEQWKNPEESAPALRDGRTDGILVVGPQLNWEILDTLNQLSVPTVAISAQTHGNTASVDVDNFAGAHLAASHLLESGHRRIAYLSGNEDLASYQPRLDGFCEALKEFGVEPKKELLLLSRFDGTLAFEQTIGLLNSPEPPTAICAGNDKIALQVIAAADSVGIKVPSELSVIGFDDIPASRHSNPALTTIRQPLHQIGETAATLLIKQIVDKQHTISTTPIFLAPELIVRNSTASIEYTI